MKKLVESKALGIPMLPDIAKELDDLIARLPKTKEYAYRRKTFTGGLQSQARPSLLKSEEPPQKNARWDISIISNSALDHDNEVIMPRGVALETFRKRMIVPWAHKYDQPNPCFCRWIIFDKHTESILAKTIYRDRPDNTTGYWLADDLWDAKEHLKAKSIGVQPTKVRDATKEELKARPELKDCELVISECVCFEYSVVMLGANETANILSSSQDLKERQMSIIDRLSIDPEKIARKVLEKTAVKRK